MTDPELDKRQVLMYALDPDVDLLAARPGLLLIADKGYVFAEPSSPDWTTTCTPGARTCCTPPIAGAHPVPARRCLPRFGS